MFFGSPNREQKFNRGFQNFTGRTEATVSFGFDGAWDVVSGDFNGDGRTDYARLGADHDVVFLGMPPGGVNCFSKSNHGFGTLNFGFHSPWQAVAGDFDGDGMTDFPRLGDTDAFVFMAAGSGTFTTRFHDYTSGSLPLGFGYAGDWGARTGDFDGDGKIDYARVGSTGTWIFSHMGHDGTFQADFQGYPDTVPPFGYHSPWQTVTGNFTGRTRNGHKKAGFLRLGADSAYHTFIP